MRAVLRKSGIVATAALFAVASACSKADREAASDTVAAGASAVAARAESAAVATVQEYTPAELSGFINTFNDQEVAIAEMAQAKATDPQVVAFAKQVAGDYKALKADVIAAARKLGVTPAMPGNDEGLISDHTRGMNDLNAKARGKEFDEAYLEHEIRMHKKVLDEVNDALIRTQTAGVRALLEKARAGLETNLKTAEELEKKFGA